MLFALALQRMGIKKPIITPNRDAAVRKVMFDADDKRGIGGGVRRSEAHCRSAVSNVS